MTGWDFYGFLRNPSWPNMPNADTRFVGPVTIPALDAVGGEGYAGAKVPVENGAGTAGMALSGGVVIDLRNDVPLVPVRVLRFPWIGRK